MKLDKIIVNIKNYSPPPNTLNCYLVKNFRIMLYEYEGRNYCLDFSLKGGKTYLVSKEITNKNIRKILHDLITKEVDLRGEMEYEEKDSFSGKISLIMKKKNLINDIFYILPDEESFLGLSEVIANNIDLQKKLDIHFYKNGYYLSETNEECRFKFIDEDEKLFFITEKIPTLLPNYLLVKQKVKRNSLALLLSSIFKNNDLGRLDFENSLNLILRGKSVESKVFFVLKGKPDTGKSLVSKIVYLMFLPSETWFSSPSKLNSRFENTNFIKRKLLLINEYEETFSNNVMEKIKKITGGDSLELEEKFIQSRTAESFKGSLLITTNHDIFPNGNETGIPQRKFVINFDQKIYPSQIFKDDKDFKSSTKILPTNINDSDSHIQIEEIINYKHHILSTYTVDHSVSHIREKIKANVSKNDNLSFKPIEAFVKSFIEPRPEELKKNLLIGKKKMVKFSNEDEIKTLSKKEGVIFHSYLKFMSTLNEEIKSRTVSSFKDELENYFREDLNYKSVSIKRTSGYNFRILNADLIMSEEFFRLFLN